jgi:hypothetical protein
MRVADKAGNRLGWNDIMYKDDLLLVSDGTRTTTYSLKDMYEVISSEARLRYLKVNGFTVDGFHPDTFAYRILLDQRSLPPRDPIVHAAPRHANASVTIEQVRDLNGNVEERTAGVKVVAEDGTTSTAYSVVFDLVTEMTEKETEPVKIFSEGMTICIRSVDSGSDRRIEVYSLRGERVMQGRIASSYERIEVQAPEGLYIVKVDSRKGTYVQKVVLNYR